MAVQVYGAVRQRTARFAVAYDLNYEDNEDRWSVIGDDRGNNFEAKPVGGTGEASLVVPWLCLVGSTHWLRRLKTVPLEIYGFFDCPCDHTKFRFTIREQRRVGQQE